MVILIAQVVRIIEGKLIIVDDIIKAYISMWKIFNPKTNLWETLSTMTNTEQKKFNILEHDISELQLRDGREILGVFKRGVQTALVVYKDELINASSIVVELNGVYSPLIQTSMDIILKPKKKVIKAPFIFRNSEGFPELMPCYLTEEKAKNWCTIKANFIKWLGNTPLAIECDEE